MNAATILLVLASAGQTRWTPDRYSSPPPAAAPSAAAAPNYDRYATPPPSTQSRVAPPPGIVDRTRTAVTETGTTLRDGLEAGIDAANEQLSQGGNQMIDATRGAGREFQSWTEDAGRQFQSAGDNLPTTAGPTLGATGNGPVTNPFGASSAPPASPKTRGGVAPPPWTGPAATTEPDWSTDLSRPDAPAERSRSAGLAQPQTESGWTSIRSDVAAPPLLVPQLLTTTGSESGLRTASNDRGPNFAATSSRREPIHSPLADPSRPAEPAATAADWSTGWGTGPAAQPATIGRPDSSSSASAGSDTRLASQQSATQRPQEARQANTPASQQSSNGWGDLWAENDPLPELPQRQPAKQSPHPDNQASSPPIAHDHGNQHPPGASAVNAAGSSNGAPVVILPAAASQPARVPSASPTAAEQPNWVPLIVVSLSLAGSLGANLFLGFSYLDARQRYSSLARKTANAFRSSAAAA